WVDLGAELSQHRVEVLVRVTGTVGEQPVIRTRSPLFTRPVREVCGRIGIAAIGVELHVRPEAVCATWRGIRKEAGERLGTQIDLKADALPVFLQDELDVLPARVDVRLEEDLELHAALRAHAVRTFRPSRPL